MVGQQVRNATTTTRMVNIGALIVQSLSKSNGHITEPPVHLQKIASEPDAPEVASPIDKTESVVKPLLQPPMQSPAQSPAQPMSASMLRGLMTGGYEIEA